MGNIKHGRSITRRLTVLFIILDLALIGAGGWLYIHTDREKPVLQFSENMAEVYEETMDEAELLQGVTAIDETDGDVTASVLIEKIVEASDGTIIVTYAARDKSNNVAKKSKTFWKNNVSYKVGV